MNYESIQVRIIFYAIYASIRCIYIVEGSISKSRELRLGILAMFYLEGFYNDWLRAF